MDANLAQAELATSFGPKEGRWSNPAAPGRVFTFHMYSASEAARIHMNVLQQYPSLDPGTALDWGVRSERGSNVLPLALARLQVVLDGAPADYYRPGQMAHLPPSLDVFYSVAKNPERSHELLLLNLAYSEFVARFYRPQPLNDVAAVPDAGTALQVEGHQTAGTE